jgi:hypothetical protein
VSEIRASRPRQLETALTVLSAVCAGISVQVGFAFGVMSVANESWAEVAWTAGVLACAGASVFGLVVRKRRPFGSMCLLGVGAIGPSLALFWLPPVYLLTIATIAVAIASTVRHRPAQAAA